MGLTKSRNRMTSGAPLIALDRGVHADGSTDDRAILAACETAAAFVDLSPGTYRVASNITLTKVIRFAPGAILKPDNGITITLTGEIVAGAWQIFDVSAGGTIAGPVRNQLIYPDWWGAAPGVASDQSAKIQACITFAQANGRTVYLRNGLWRCDNTLYMREPASIVGDPGIAAQSVTSTQSTLDFSNAAANVSGLVIGRTIDFPLDGITLRDIAIYRSVLVTTGAGCIGLQLDSVMQAEVVNVQAWNWDIGYQMSGSATYPCSQCHFTSCRSQYAATYHWDIWSAIDTVYDRCFGGGGPAVYCWYVYENVLAGAAAPNAQHWTNCICVSADADNGIRILAGFYHLIEDSVFEEMDEAGVLISIASTDISLMTVWITECGFNNCGDGIGSVGAAGNLRIRDCRIESSNAASQYGIIIDAASGAAVERDIIIEGCSIKHAAAGTVGIYINRVKGAIIENNRIFCTGAASATAGIDLGAATELCIVSNNRSLTTFASADGISNNGTGNVLSGNTKY